MFMKLINSLIILVLMLILVPLAQAGNANITFRDQETGNLINTTGMFSVNVTLSNTSGLLNTYQSNAQGWVNFTTGNGAYDIFVKFTNQSGNTIYYPNVVPITIPQQLTVYATSSNSYVAIIKFSIQDHTGLFPTTTSKLYLDKWLPFNNTLTTISGGSFDLQGAFVSYMLIDHQYTLRIRNSIGYEKTLGYYIPIGSASESIPIATFAIKNVTSAYNGFIYYFTSTNTSVWYTWSDVNDEVNWINMSVTNSTNKTTYNSTSTSGTFNQKLNHSEAYTINVTVLTNNYGFINTTYYKVPWTGEVIPIAIDGFLKMLFGIGITFMFAFTFNRMHSGIGAIVVAVLASGFFSAGWFDSLYPDPVIRTGIVAIAVSVSIIAFLSKR